MRARQREMGENMGCSGIYKLPEGCISLLLSLTSPRDTCRSALVSTTFRSAVDSDVVWGRFLPADHKEIVARAVNPVQATTKRDLYFRLCDPIFIDDGKMMFYLEKSSGIKCFALPARELSIIWGDSPHYWKWTSLPNSRFPEVAVLLNVCWLEIRGKIDSRILSPKTSYAAYLVFKTDAGSYGLGRPFQEASVKVGAHVSTRKVCLLPDESEPEPRLHAFRRFMNWRGQAAALQAAQGERAAEELNKPRARNDGWLELVLGEFFNDMGDDGEVDMSLLEVEGGHWKNGLIVQGIEVRPKAA